MDHMSSTRIMALVLLNCVVPNSKVGLSGRSNYTRGGAPNTQDGLEGFKTKAVIEGVNGRAARDCVENPGSSRVCASLKNVNSGNAWNFGNVRNVSGRSFEVNSSGATGRVRPNATRTLKDQVREIEWTASLVFLVLIERVPRRGRIANDVEPRSRRVAMVRTSGRKVRDDQRSHEVLRIGGQKPGAPVRIRKITAASRLRFLRRNPKGPSRDPGAVSVVVP